MTYRDLLEQAPIDYLQLLASENGIRPDIDRERLRQALWGRLTDPQYLARITHRFDQHTRTVLRLLTFISDDAGIASPLVHQKLVRLARDWGSDPGHFLHPLTRKGLVVSVTTGPSRYFYLVPNEIRQHLVSIFAGDVRESFELLSEAPKTHRYDAGAFLRDLYTFLAWIRFNPPKITQAGSIYKRSQKQLLQLLEATDVPPHFRRDEGELSRLDWMQQFCMAEGFIEVQDGVLSITSSARAWFQRTTQEQLQSVFGFWMERQPYLFVHVAVRLLNIMEPEQWISLGSLQQQIQAFSPEILWENTLNERFFEWMIHPWIYFGFIKYSMQDKALCLSQTGYRILNNLSLEQEEPVDYTMIVQPNYEVLVDRRLAPEIRWELEQFALLQKNDQMVIYRICQDSIYRAMKTGMEAEPMIGFLKQYSRTGVPQNVAYAIREWASHYGQLEFMDVLLLRCKDEQLAEELGVNPKLKPHILGKLTPTDLIVNRAGQRHFMKLLEQAGYMPKPTIVYASEKTEDDH